MGNKSNGFDFDDFEFEDEENSLDGDIDNVDSEFLEKRNVVMDKGTKRKVIRNSIIGIVCAIILLVVIGLIVGAVSKKKGNEGSVNSSIEKEEVKVEENSWIGIKEQDITFFTNYIESKFTVINISHYARKVDSNNIQLISKIKGSIEGFNGEYEIELPYTKGSKLEIGSAFLVKVKIGEGEGIKFIGEITV